MAEGLIGEFEPRSTVGVTVKFLQDWICRVGQHLNKAALQNKADQLARLIIEENDFDTQGEIAALSADDLMDMGVTPGNARALDKFLASRPRAAQSISPSKSAVPKLAMRSTPQSVGSSPATASVSREPSQQPARSRQQKYTTDSLMETSRQLRRRQEKILGQTPREEREAKKRLEEEAAAAVAAAAAAAKASAARSTTRRPEQSPELLQAALAKAPAAVQKADRAAKMEIKCCMTPQFAHRVDAVFAQMDVDGSGVIDLEELSDVHAGDAIKMLVLVDKDRTGAISLDEWREWFEQLTVSSGEHVAEFQLRYH